MDEGIANLNQDLQKKDSLVEELSLAHEILSGNIETKESELDKTRRKLQVDEDPLLTTTSCKSPAPVLAACA